MTYEEYLYDIDSLGEDVDQLNEDISNIQTAIFRLQDVANDSFENIIMYTVKKLEKHMDNLEQQKKEIDERIVRYNEHLQ